MSNSSNLPKQSVYEEGLLRPFFSIIIPVYNGEKHLIESAQSALSQHFDDFELVLVNDGSQDQSAALCDKLAKEHPGKVRVFHQENKGVMCARLLGLEQALGEFILYLDADDTLRKDALEVMAGLIKEQGADLVFFRPSCDPEYRKIIWDYPFEDEEVFEGKTLGKIYQLLASGNSMNSLCTKAIHRDLFDRSLTCRDYSHMILGEDLLMSLKPFEQSRKMAYTKEILYYYRPNPDSATRARFSIRHFNAIRTVGPARLDLIQQKEPSFPGLLDTAFDYAYQTCQNHVTRAMMTGTNWQETRSWLETMRQDAFFRDALQKGRPSGAWPKRLLTSLTQKGHWGILKMIFSMYRLLRGK